MTSSTLRRVDEGSPTEWVHRQAAPLHTGAVGHDEGKLIPGSAPLRGGPTLAAVHTINVTPKGPALASLVPARRVGTSHSAGSRPAEKAAPWLGPQTTAQSCDYSNRRVVGMLQRVRRVVSKYASKGTSCKSQEAPSHHP